mmetsp:Transcript_71157/g.118262  ORF Transcript_71157/g.118262 Transcript_71157/m.118262 type:complete len:173 (-) Transcript_71157:107-625(-)
MGHEIVLDLRPHNGATWLHSNALDVDEAVVNRLTEELLANDAANMKWLPDEVERHMYNNSFRLVIGLLQEILSSTSLRLGGQLICLDLRPATLPSSLGSDLPRVAEELPHDGEQQSQQARRLDAELCDLRQAERTAIATHAAQLVEIRMQKERVKRELRAVDVRARCEACQE